MLRFGTLLCTIFLGMSVFVAVAAVAQETSQRDRARSQSKNSGAREYTLKRVKDISGRADNGPKAGVVAPDFSLTPLKFYEFGIDDTEITEENAGALYDSVTLSDFRGKKPVVLIFGSYT